MKNPNIDELVELLFAEGLQQEEVNILNVRSIIFWQSLARNKARRIVIDPNEVEDSESNNIVIASIQEFKRTRRNLLQILLNAEIDGTLAHPNGKEFKSTGKRKKGSICWGEDSKFPSDGDSEADDIVELTNGVVLVPDITDQTHAEFYLKGVDLDLQKIKRNSFCLEHKEAVLEEMRKKYADLMNTSKILAPQELDMIRQI